MKTPTITVIIIVIFIVFCLPLITSKREREGQTEIATPPRKDTLSGIVKFKMNGLHVKQSGILVYEVFKDSSYQLVTNGWRVYVKTDTGYTLLTKKNYEFRISKP